MRLSRFILFLALLTSVFGLSSPVNAKNVLLPSDNASAATEDPEQPSLPNLGLTPSPSTQTTTTPTTTDVAPKETSTPSAANKSLTVPNASALSYGLVKKVQEEKNKATMSDYKKALQEIEARERRSDELRKPTFMQDEPDMPPADYLLSDLNMSMNVKIESSYLWGAGDVERISKVFGFKPQEISANCQLRFDTRVISTEGRSYRLNVYAGDQATLKYTGQPQTVEFNPRAVCNKPAGQLSSSGETIRVSGNKYIIQLTNAAKCATNGPASTVTMKYTGDGTAKCKAL